VHKGAHNLGLGSVMVTLAAVDAAGAVMLLNLHAVDNTMPFCHSTTAHHTSCHSVSLSECNLLCYGLTSTCQLHAVVQVYSVASL
jgi:hypothetical protein